MKSTRGNAAVQDYTIPNLQVTQIDSDMAGGTPNQTAYNQTVTLGYSTSGQIKTRGQTNPVYEFAAPSAGTANSTINGLNQVTVTGSTSYTYDSKGNLSGDGTNSYGYDIDNQLISAAGATLTYDAAHRLASVAKSGTTTSFLYDGADIIAEYNGSTTLLRRYVHGAGVDEPINWYEGTGTTDRRWLTADERGSIVAIAADSGVVTYTNNYDSYGKPGPSNQGRFQYTGQTWVSEAGLYNYKARFYSPTMGRFLQPDPIGYGDGLNLYAYVGGDPINGRDPTGTTAHRVTCSGYDGQLLTIHDDDLYNAVIYNGSCSDYFDPVVVTAVLTPQSDCMQYQGCTAPSQGNRGIQSAVNNPAVSVETQMVQGPQILESRRGERGYTGSNHGTPKPYKGFRPVPGKPGFGQVKDPQTGKLSGPKPWPDDPRLNDPNGNNSNLIAAGGAVVVGGAIICAIAEPCGAIAAGWLGLGAVVGALAAAGAQ